MKKILITTLLFCLFLALSGCNKTKTIIIIDNTTSSDDGTNTKKVEPTPDKLVVWSDATYWGGENEKIIINMLNEYTKETGIKVEYVAQLDLATKMNAAPLGGESPDVLIWDRWQTKTYIEQNMLVCLDNYISEDGINTDDYQQVALKEMCDNEMVYGMPLDIDAWGYWVNKTALIEANITEVDHNGNTVAKLPKTWDELRDAAKKTTKYDSSGNIIRNGLNLDCSGSFFSYIQTAGGKMFNDDQSQVAFNDEHGFAVLKYWYEMIHTDKVFNKDIMDLGGTDDPFAQGRVVIQINSLLNGNALYRSIVGDKFDYEFIPFPMGPSTEFATANNLAGTNTGGLMGGYGLTIPRTTKYPDHAWDLIKWWVTDNATKWAEISGLIPAKLTIISDPKLKDIPNVRNVIDILPYIKARPDVPGYPSIESGIIMSKITGLLFENAYSRGAQTSDDKIRACLKDMEQQANATLEFMSDK